MKSVAGVFRSTEDALKAFDRLTEIGIPYDRINFLGPESSMRELARVPTTEAERPGIGKAIGAVVGGAVGASLGPGALAFASIVIPGIGAVGALGLYAAALFGAGGAVLGGTAAGKLEEGTSEGLPRDELFLYEDALRQGRTVLIAMAEDSNQAEVARGILADAGAESVDAARERWWIGLRDAEKEHYTASGHDFSFDEPVYQKGFEAALHPDLRGRSWDEAETELRRLYPEHYNLDAFRSGYERGHKYLEWWREKQPV